MTVIDRFHCISDNTVETVNNGQPKDLSKVAIIGRFRASKGQKEWPLAALSNTDIIIMRIRRGLLTGGR